MGRVKNAWLGKGFTNKNLQKKWSTVLKGLWVHNSNLNVEIKESASLRRHQAENYILQLNFGIIPFDLWREKQMAKKDPMEGFSEKEILTAKRKFRKLKKILATIHKVPYERVSFSGRFRQVWISNTNEYLRKKEGI